MSFPHRAAAVATLRFVLPFPPSVNRYYRHVGYRTLLSREGRQYRAAVCTRLAGRVQQPLSVPLQAELHLYPPDRRRRDWDNFQKGVWDSLQHAGIYLDDSQVRRAVIEMHEPDGKARAECHIQPLAADVDAGITTRCSKRSAMKKSPGRGGARSSIGTAPSSCSPATFATTD